MPDEVLTIQEEHGKGGSYKTRIDVTLNRIK